MILYKWQSCPKCSVSKRKQIFKATLPFDQGFLPSNTGHKIKIYEISKVASVGNVLK